MNSNPEFDALFPAPEETQSWHSPPPSTVSTKLPKDAVLPLPDVISPADTPWEIYDGEGTAEIASRRMYAPTGDTDYEKERRFHLQMHNKYSPDLAEVLRARAKLNPKYLKIAEDIRLHEIQHRLGYEVGPIVDRAEARRIAKNVARLALQVDRLAALMAVWHNTRLKNQILNALDPEEAKDSRTRIPSLLRHFLPVPPKVTYLDFRTTIEMAVWMDRKQKEEKEQQERNERYAREAEEMASRHRPRSGMTDAETRALESGQMINGAYQPDDMGESEIEYVRKISQEFAKGFTPPIIDRDDIWGKMTIDDAPLCRTANPHKTARRKFSVDEGVIPERIQQYCSSGRIFMIKRRELGGSILLDCSGSMSLSVEDVMRLVELAPASLIAGYGGFERTGVLRVFVRRGMRVEDQYICDPAAGNNVVDGPALLWLARQGEPRYWISDGGVTGIGDSYSSTKLRAHAAAICHQYRIRRIQDIETALEVLLGRAVARRAA